MRRARGSTTLCIALVLVIGNACISARAFDASFASRRTQALQQFNLPPNKLSCAPLRIDKERCSWRQMAGALLALSRRDLSLDADGLLLDVAENLPSNSAWRHSPDLEASNDEEKVDPAWDFPFLTSTLMFRAVAQFGPASTAERKISGATVDAIRSVFWNWASTECRLADADPALVWTPWSTENHDVQRAHTCWAAAELLASDTHYTNNRFADDSTVSQQRLAWTKYFKALIKARATHGVSIEFFSPTYSKYFLSVFYNIMDFSSDPNLRVLARDFITLWWAIWSQEQVDGNHGGGKARFYYNQKPDDTPLDGIPWVYFNIGSHQRVAQIPHLPILLSDYTPPPVVGCIAAGGGGPVAQESWTLESGLRAQRSLNKRVTISQELGSLVRYTYRNEGYVMGSVAVPRLNAKAWAAISSQNRWSGVVMAGPIGARVFAAPARASQRSNYNGTTAVQRHDTMIVQRLPQPFSRAAGPMQIYVGPSLRVVEKGKWIFAEGSAYVATRPAYGDYRRGGDKNVFYLLADDSPVIIQAGTKTDFPSFESFQEAILSSSLVNTSDEVSFQGPRAATPLTMSLRSEVKLGVQGTGYGPPTGWLYKGPFVEARENTSTVRVTCQDDTLTLNFK